MGSPAPQLGTTRTGGQFDPNLGYLGGDPNALANIQQQSNQAAYEARRAGEHGSQRQNAVGNDALSYGNAAAQRQAQTAQGATAQGTQANYGNGAQQGVQGQLGSAQALMGMAQAPQGPSAAQAQLQQGTNDALNAQLALARSGTGAGESAAAMDSARFNSAGIMASNANQAAQLRATEDAAYRDRQLAAANAAGGQFGGAAGTAANMSQFNAAQGQQNQQFNAAQQQQNQQFNVSAGQSQQQINDAAALGGMGLASNAYGQGTAQQLAASQQGLSATGLNLQANQAQTAAGQGLAGLQADVYGAELQHQLGMRELDQNKSQGWISGVTGAVGAAAGVASLFSDRRGKTNIRKADYSHVFAALGD